MILISRFATTPIPREGQISPAHSVRQTMRSIPMRSNQNSNAGKPVPESIPAKLALLQARK